MQIIGPANNVLIEDCQVEYFRDNVAITAWNGNPSNIQFRNNVVNNSWSTPALSTGGKSQGLYVSGTNGITIEGNVFDHNGWNEQIPGANATIYGHNVYMWASNSNVVFKNNISANAGSHGLQARSGGDIENNLFLNDPIGLMFGKGSTDMPGGVSGSIRGNVFLGDRDINGMKRGWAIEVGNLKPGGGTVISNNIIADDKQMGFAAIRLMSTWDADNPQDAAGLNDLIIENNVVHNWYQAMDLSPDFIDGGTGPSAFHNVTVENNDFETTGQTRIISHNSTLYPSQETWSGNNYYNPQSQNGWFTIGHSTMSYDMWHAQVDTSGTAEVKDYTDANRTVAGYSASLGQGASDAAFVANADQMSADHFNPAYGAAAAIAWIKAGFQTPAGGRRAGADTAAPGAVGLKSGRRRLWIADGDLGFGRGHCRRWLYR